MVQLSIYLARKISFHEGLLMNVVLLLLLCLVVEGFAEGNKNAQPFSCVSAKIGTGIVIDGKIDPAEWANAEKSELKYEVNPGDNLPTKQRTEFYSAHDDQNLYFAFKCYDTDPQMIRAHKCDRDQIFSDDFVGIILDPYRDNQHAYELFVNPYGVQGDLMRTGNNEDATFDMIWKTAGQITDYGYCVEMAIPYTSIRFPRDGKNGWNLVALRIYPRDSRYNFSWTPMDRDNPCMMCQSGLLSGLEDVKSPLKLEVLPYVVGFQRSGLDDSDDPSSVFSKGKPQGRMGIGLKITPNSDMLIESVINPDFSQVESDAQQISVNSSFALYYSEKRPFFLEGSDLFSGRIVPFYSRMINSPDFATKVLGKEGRLTYAMLLSYDKQSPFIVPGEEGSDFVETDKASMSAVFRGKYTFGGESYIGSILTSRDFHSAGNQLAGLDWTYQFLTNLYFKGQYLYSYTKELNAMSLFDDTRPLGHSGKDAAFNGESLQGSLLRLEFDRMARNHYFELDYYDASPQFRADMGYINKTDARTVEFENGYQFYPDSSSITSGYLFAHGGMTFTHEHEQKEKYIVTGLQLQLKSQINLYLAYLPLNDEKYKSVQFNNINRSSFNLFTRPFSALTVSLYGDIGRFIKREDDPAIGRGHSLGSDITVKPTDALQLTFSYSRFRLSDISTNELFVDQYIMRNVSTYQINREIFVRLISEYNSSSKSFSVYPLLSYKLNPFTLCYIGSTYNLQQYQGYNGYRQTERQFFAKIQYLWNAI